MSTTTHGRALRTLTSTLLLALLSALLLAGSALAAGHGIRAQSAKPGKPTATAPQGTITTAKPTFTWSKAPRAARYELRVYKGTQLQLKKTGLKKRSWTSSTALPTGVDLTWKVRASNARGAGAWSRSLQFRTTEPAIGVAYGGGIVAYVLHPGDPGYAAGQTHGLIAAALDQTLAVGTIQWATEPFWHTDVPGAHGTAIGTGAANTHAIIAQNGAGTTYAAGLARAYTGGGYSDWYLPSKDELRKLYLNRAAIGGFRTPVGDFAYYWSSSQHAADASLAWLHCFADDCQASDCSKDGPYGAYRVRAVRAF